MAWFYNIISLLADVTRNSIDDEEFIAWVCDESEMQREAYDAIMFSIE